MSHLRAVPDRPARAVLYLRQSTHRDDSISLELQESAGREYCLRRGYDVVAVEADPGISGRTWDRPAVRRTMSMIEERDADVIVVWKWSRLSRSRRDWAIAVDKIEATGGRLESSTEPVDTTTSTGRFTRGMLAELAAFESDRIGDVWRESHARRRKLGLPHSGSPRLGYTYSAETKSFSPDPEMAPIVRELYRRYIDGAGLVTLSKWLRDLHIDSPRSRKPWTHPGLAQFLDGGFAAGYLRIHDPACPDRHPSGAWCLRKTHLTGAHEPIIDDETWQTFKAARAQRATTPPRLVRPASPLSGVAQCATCQRRMALHRKPQGVYLRCARRECYEPAAVTYRAAEEAVRTWLPTVARMVDGRAASATATTAAEKVERARLQRIVSEVERTLQQLTIDHAKRLVPTSAYEGARDQLVDEQHSASIALQKLDRRTASIDHAAVAAQLLDEWDTLDPAGISRMLRDLVVVTVHRREKGSPAEIVVRGAWETDTA